MAEEEKKVETPETETPETETPAAGAPATEAPKKKKKWPIVLIIIAVVLVALIAGFMVWHNQPTFCNAICHQPMDNYVNSYYDDSSNTLANEHSHASSLADTTLADGVQLKDETCLDCHEASLSEQVSEGIAWISGNYTVDAEGNLSGNNMMKNEGTTAKAFCTRCHDYTEVTASTENWGGESGVNPHSSHQGELECTNCHNAHGTSTLYCNTCHNWELPDGWENPGK